MTIRARILPRLPARVIPGPGIDASVSHGNLEASLEYRGLIELPPDVADLLAVQDPESGAFKAVPLGSLPVSDDVQDALDLKADKAIEIATENSLTGGGDLSASRTLSLVNDAPTPGNNRFYGTDASGNKGWIPGASKVDITRQVATQHSLQGGGDLSANRTLSLVGDTAAPGADRFYGTDGSGARGWHTLPASASISFATRAGLKSGAITGSGRVAFLTEGNRSGFFAWRVGDYSAQVAADTLEGVYLEADAVAASTGVWERIFDGPVHPTWWGAAGDGTTDDTAAFAAMFAYASAGRWSVFIPDGEYRLLDRLLPDKVPAIVGASETGTVLFWDSTAIERGIWWTSDSDRDGLYFAAMTLANKGSTSGTALAIDTSGQVYSGGGDPTIVQREMSRFHVERITFRGYTDVYTDGWEIHVDGIENLSSTVTRCTAIGVMDVSDQDPISVFGFRFRGSGHPAGALCHLNAIHYCGTGIQFNGYEGAFAHDNNLVSVGNGIEFLDTAGRPHFSVRGNHVNARVCCIRITNGSEAFITDNLLYAVINAPSNVQGVNISGSGGELYVIRNNQFENTSRIPGGTAINFDGIHITASGYANIGGNLFRDVDTGTLLWPGAHHCLVDDDNIYKTVRTTKVNDVSGTANNTIRTQL